MCVRLQTKQSVFLLLAEFAYNIRKCLELHFSKTLGDVSVAELINLSCDGVSVVSCFF